MFSDKQVGDFSEAFEAFSRGEKGKNQDLLLPFSPLTRQSYLENTLLSLQRF